MSGGVILLILSGLSFGAAATMDTVFRFRMAGKGHRIGLLKGGNVDYREYHKVRARYGWHAWPVYLMWASYILGIAFLIAGSFTHFGTHPTRSNQHPA
jgi:hypothetical protein